MIWHHILESFFIWKWVFVGWQGLFRCWIDISLKVAKLFQFFQKIRRRFTIVYINGGILRDFGIICRVDKFFVCNLGCNPFIRILTVYRVGWVLRRKEYILILKDIISDYFFSALLIYFWTSSIRVIELIRRNNHRIESFFCSSIQGFGWRSFK